MQARRGLLALLVVAECVAITPGSTTRSRSGGPSARAAPAALPWLGSEMQLSPPADPDFDRFRPAIAHNCRHGEYLVVWHSDHLGGFLDIYARRVTDSGVVKSWFAVASGGGPGGDGKNRMRPAVAADIPGYLIAYEEESPLTKRHVFARLWRPETTFLPLLIRG